MGGRGASSGRSASRGGHRPTLNRVGNADFYSDEYGTNTVKKITQGAYAGSWRAEMAPTPKNNLPEGMPLPQSQVSYHRSLEDAQTSIKAYHDSINEYSKRFRR